jgi:tetratricopeptide (TPR) repeat protein
MWDYLKKASTLSNRDLRYYELTVGTAFTAILPTIQQVAATPDMTQEQVVARLAAHLAPLRADLEGLARFAPSRAAVLQVLVDGAVEVVAMRGTSVAHVMPVIARAWRRALEIRGRYPAEPDAHKLVSLLAGFGPVPIDEVEAVVTEPLPDRLADRDAVVEGRASLYLRMMLYGARLEWLPRLEALVTSLPASSWIARNLRADAVGLAAIAGQSGWDPVVIAYRAILPEAPDDPERARIENNIGVALYRAGKQDDARAAWDRAMQLEPEYPVPELNHAAASDGAPYGLEKLTTIASSAELSGVGFQAAAWRRHFGLARGEKGVGIDALRKEHFADSYGFAPDGGLGAIVGGSFKISFGYHSSNRLVIELATEARTWLCLPAPGTAPAAGKKPAR